MHGWRGTRRSYRAARPWRVRLAAVLGAAVVSAMAAAGVLAFAPAQPGWAAGRPAPAAGIVMPQTEPGAATIAAAPAVVRVTQAAPLRMQAAPPPAQQGIRPDGVLGRWAAFGLLAAIVVIWITLIAGVVRVFIGMVRRQ